MCVMVATTRYQLRVRESPTYDSLLGLSDIWIIIIYMHFECL